MHVNTDPPTPARLPSIRDMHELLRDHLPLPLIKLTPLEELARRCTEIALEHPRFQEEAPLVLQGETRRRRRLMQFLPQLATHSYVA